MNKVTFQNNGEIDIRSVVTFGISSKDKENPIGYFGTGFKYAIAVILRNGCDIEVWSGNTRYEFTLQTVKIRNDEFNIVFMNGKETGITDSLGKDWKMWEAYRELHCNTLDEDGTVAPDYSAPAIGKTTVIVSGEPFYTEYMEKAINFIEGEPLHSNSEIELHAKTTQHIYYRGVRASHCESTSLFTYNVLGKCNLTENRTISNSDVVSKVAGLIVKSTDKDLIKKFISAPDGTYEQRLDLDWFNAPSQEFLEVVADLSFRNVTSYTAIAVYKKHRGPFKPTVAKADNIQSIQIEKAKGFLLNLGFDVTKDVNVSDDMPENVLGMVYEGDIYLSKRVFMMGTKMVCGTILEEWLHAHNGLRDETREMQNYLFDLIVTLGEQVNGEPL